ncbi:uncharacterized protein LOC133194137 [Saccostrea echinata]|uniref:uncharacterized protein LOC133194137 n=1 Tax=Saccostrea echinata TaxID=191078 RepID=UPI002A81E062|nr:uncharacterized protein LOC133194137 [Saccostrea echinata]
MAVNQQRKRAMKRLMQDYEELQREPVENVSAMPLDANVFEWHCNFKHDDIIYHLILFFTEKYPYDSPSAEFVPVGFRYNSGATMPGKVGTKVCLNIFSDFAYIHTEWKDEKSVGWSPGYTVQTILLNVVAFLAETQSGDYAWMKDASDHNRKISKGFKCDCGHTYAKPLPAFDAGKPEKSGKKTDKKGKQTKAAASGESVPDIIDYASKERFDKSVKPKSNDDLFGYGLIVSGPPHRPALTTPCEFIKLESFEAMKKAIGTVKSVMKEDIKFFLPMYITPNHGSMIKETFEKCLNEVAAILPKCKPNKTPLKDLIIKVIPNLMSATVVEFSKGTQHTSENSLNGYFSLHRLFLWALDTYPELQEEIDSRLKVFIDDVSERSKKACPHIGEWLMLLAASFKYRWQDAAWAYLSESFKRNVMWYVKEDAKLGMLDTDKDYRIRETLQRTLVSRKLLAFQVLFLDIAMPKGKSKADLVKRYDNNLGFPTEEMVKQMKESVQLINNMKTYSDWFNVLKIKPLRDDEVFDKLVSAVQYAIDTDGYHWTFWKTGGGWGEVLRRYKPYKKKEDKDTGKKKADDDDVEPSAKKKKPALKKEDSKPKGRGRGGKAAAAAAKPAGRGAKKAEEEPKAPVGRGRGRGQKRKAEDPAPVGRGRGGKKKK